MANKPNNVNWDNVLVLILILGFVGCVTTCTMHSNSIDEQAREFDRLHPVPPECGSVWLPHPCMVGEKK